MSKLQKLTRALECGGSWPKYLWYAMRQDERSYERYAREARSFRFGAKIAALDGKLALTFARAADMKRGWLGL